MTDRCCNEMCEAIWSKRYTNSSDVHRRYPDRISVNVHNILTGFTWFLQPHQASGGVVTGNRLRQRLPCSWHFDAVYLVIHNIKLKCSPCTSWRQMEERRYNCPLSETLHWLEVNGRLHALAVLTQWKTSYNYPLQRRQHLSASWCGPF